MTLNTWRKDKNGYYFITDIVSNADMFFYYGWKMTEESGLLFSSRIVDFEDKICEQPYLELRRKKRMIRTLFEINRRK